MKILVISLAGIGDTLLATPLIRELRANFPEAQIDALVLWAGSKDLLEGNPFLNTIYQRNFLKESRIGSLRFLWPLRQAHYDISINTHPQSRIHYRATARFVGASQRISHIYECFGALDRLLINKTLPQDYRKNSVDLNLEILGLLGRKPTLPHHSLDIFLSQVEHSWADDFLKTHSLAKSQRIGVHVGSGGTKNLTLKRWPLDHYVQLLANVRKAWPDLAILLFGGPEEEADLQRILEQHKSPNPAIAGRNLDYYRYDGQGIHGTREELTRLMASVTPDAVYEALARCLAQ